MAEPRDAAKRVCLGCGTLTDQPTCPNPEHVDPEPTQPNLDVPFAAIPREFAVLDERRGHLAAFPLGRDTKESRLRRYCFTECADPWFNECADCWRDGGNPALWPQEASSRFYIGSVIGFARHLVSQIGNFVRRGQ